MAAIFGNLSFIIAVLFYVFFCGTMAAMAVTLRKMEKEVAEVKKALTSLDERLAILAPQVKAAATNN